MQLADLGVLQHGVSTGPDVTRRPGHTAQPYFRSTFALGRQALLRESCVVLAIGSRVEPAGRLASMLSIAD